MWRRPSDSQLRGHGGRQDLVSSCSTSVRSVVQSDVTPKGPKADPEFSVDFDVDLWRHEEGVREQIS